MTAPPPQSNTARAAALIDELVRQGVATFFVCPGSRSTPLVAAIARHPQARAHVVLDERVAGFAALGVGRSGGLAAVLTTSGTAVANLAPAFAEAAADDVPWLALTADRPWQDHEVGANQTLEQARLLTPTARATLDIGAPPDGVSDEALRARLRHVLTSLRGPMPGPVHINSRFSKPLEPTTAEPHAPAVRAAEPADEPVAAPLLTPSRAFLTRVGRLLADAERGVVVIGSLPAAQRAAAQALAERSGWPVIADITSGLPRPLPHAVPTAALRVDAARATLAPDVVLWIGGRMTDPVVEAWARGARVVQVLSTLRSCDPEGIVDIVLRADVSEIARAGLSFGASIVVPDAVLAAAVAAPGHLCEPRVASEVASSMRPGEALFVGSSMPIRDVDRFGLSLAPDVLLVANRGVSGIDGSVATAIGACLGSGRPTTALVGDLTLLHDAGALGAAAQLRAPLRVVVVNNGGGGIFSFLPIRDHESSLGGGLFERFFETPHQTDLLALAKAYGVQATRVRDVGELGARLATPPEEPELIEVHTDRAENLALHKDLDRQAAQRYVDAC